MASRKRNGAAERAQDREKMLNRRLRLIKKRYEELIVRPRDGLLRGFMDDDGFNELEEREEELQVLDCYGFGR